jgi:hypothetical protein
VDTEHAAAEDLRIWLITGEGASAYGAEFGWSTAGPGFTGWVGQWVEGRDWFDADPSGSGPVGRA